MKTITAHEHELITSTIGEGLTALPAGVIEKDLLSELPFEHFAAMVAGDAAQYRNQYPEFEQNPVGQMRVVMAALQDEPEAFDRNYAQFVDELVFGEPVTFVEARASFVGLAERLLSHKALAEKSTVK